MFDETIMSRKSAEAAYAHAAKTLARITELEEKYSPDLPDGSVIAFNLTFPRKVGFSQPNFTYSYAAIRAAGQWFFTGRMAGRSSAGHAIEWIVLLDVFENFAVSGFTVLRTGTDESVMTQVEAPSENGGTIHLDVDYSDYTDEG